MRELRQIIELFKQQLRQIEYQITIMEKQLKLIEKVISENAYDSILWKARNKIDRERGGEVERHDLSL